MKKNVESAKAQEVIVPFVIQSLSQAGMNVKDGLHSYFLCAATLGVIGQTMVPVNPHGDSIYLDENGKIRYRRIIPGINPYVEPDGFIPIVNPPPKPKCDLCYGYGMWPGEWIPVKKHELDYTIPDVCPKCKCDGDDCSPPWEQSEGSSENLHAAMKKFKRKVCAVSSAIQVKKVHLDL